VPDEHCCLKTIDALAWTRKEQVDAALFFTDDLPASFEWRTLSSSLRSSRRRPFCDFKHHATTTTTG
jgi:hypothetical protein